MSTFPVDFHNPMPVIDADHQRVDNGEMFSISGKATITAGATAYFLGITNGRIANFRAGSVKSSGAPCDIYFYENPTVSANGTPVTGINRNRASTRTQTMETYSGPTVTDTGDAIEYGIIVQTGAGNTGGFADLFGAGWLLDRNTSYLIGITNNDTGTITVGYNFLWYEVQPA